MIILKFMLFLKNEIDPLLTILTFKSHIILILTSSIYPAFVHIKNNIYIDSHVLLFSRNQLCF